MSESREKHYTIAIMTGDTQSDYSEEVMRGFYAAAEEEDVNIVLFMGPQIPTYCTDIVTDNSSGNYRHQFNAIYQYADFVKPDAAVIAYGSLSAFNSEHSKESFLDKFSYIPSIMTEDSSGRESVPCLIVDNYGGMKACIEHLIVDHGYRKIAFLAGPKGNFDADERLRAYRDVMAEHGLEVAKSMVIHGDYTDRVDDEVEYLLDRNPGLEAIACANDGMAKSCYRVCTLRNLIVGRNIAVTGYDDIKSACSMNPPLTSVSQNNFMNSYHALKRAVAICKGEKVTSDTIPTVLKKRCSCGCAPMNVLKVRYIPKEEMKDFIARAEGEMADHLFSSVAYGREYRMLERALTDYFDYIYDTILRDRWEAFEMEHLLDILKIMAEYPHLSNDMLLENLLQMLQILLANAFDGESQRLLLVIISSTQQYIHTFNIDKLEREIYLSNRKSWFVPMFTRNLVGEAYLDRPQDVFFRVMEEMRKMAVRSAYFFLFDEPVIHRTGEWLSFPEQISLISYFDAEDMRFFHRAEQPKFSDKRGFMEFIDGEEPVCLTPVTLFSESKQYGVMLCEVDHSNVAFLQICGVQLGTLLHFMELNQMEQQAQRKLERSMRVIEEQNSILNFLSRYDELTKLLNRRGFIEGALSLYEKSEGKKSCLIFGDLDHLKEINDVYGHAEGDFAIRMIADRFRQILPEGTVIGRIGGDEFAAFLVAEDEVCRECIQKAFAHRGEEDNESCGKPYYIDASVGIYEFICDPKKDFTEMLKLSDQLLYQAKSERRQSIQKSR